MHKIIFFSNSSYAFPCPPQYLDGDTIHNSKWNARYSHIFSLNYFIYIVYFNVHFRTYVLKFNILYLCNAFWVFVINNSYNTSILRSSLCLKYVHVGVLICFKYNTFLYVHMQLVLSSCSITLMNGHELFKDGGSIFLWNIRRSQI